MLLKFQSTNAMHDSRQRREPSISNSQGSYIIANQSAEHDQHIDISTSSKLGET